MLQYIIVVAAAIAAAFADIERSTVAGKKQIDRVLFQALPPAVAVSQLRR